MAAPLTGELPMQADRDQIERGVVLAAELPDIMPGQAGKPIHDMLWAPLVNLIFRTRRLVLEPRAVSISDRLPQILGHFARVAGPF